ncbi:MAG: low molecular weight protein-tyrosine-phosphatase [Bacteroidota bacterium]
MKILMVCLGNICRSPLAEGLMRHKVQELNLPWIIDSAGTSAWHAGEQPDKRSIAIAQKYALDISGQQARQFQRVDFQRFDLILAMDRSNFQNILKLANSDEDRAKVQMILNYVHPNKCQDVPDPYWDDNGFEQVYHMLEEACSSVLQKHA